MQSLASVLLQDAVAGLRDGVRLGVGDVAREEVTKAVRDSTRAARRQLSGTVDWVAQQASAALRRAKELRRRNGTMSNVDEDGLQDDDDGCSSDPWVPLRPRSGRR